MLLPFAVVYSDVYITILYRCSLTHFCKHISLTAHASNCIAYACVGTYMRVD
jgi:hypothetical protein